MFCMHCGEKKNANTMICERCGNSFENGAVSEESFVGQSSNSPSSQTPSSSQQTPLLEAEQPSCAPSAPTAAYAPPEGFELDPQSLLYYRDEEISRLDTGELVQRVTWFYPSTGEYEQASYPAEEAQEAQQVQEMQQVQEVAAQAMQPLPVQAAISAQMTQLSEAPIQIPEGFTLDTNSGLYYMFTSGSDPATGAQGNWYTWFTPSTGEYLQSFQATEPVQQSAYAQGALAESQPAVQTSAKPAPGGEKRKMGVLPIVLPVIALLLGAGFAFFQLGGLAWFSKPVSLEIPEGIQITSLEPGNMPQFQPVSEMDPFTATPPPKEEVKEDAAVISIEKRSYSLGESIKVTVQGLIQRTDDSQAILALYASGEGQLEDTMLELYYPSPNDASHSFSAPSTPGSYELRLFSNNSDFADESFVTLAAFTVESKQTLISLNTDLLSMIGRSNLELKEINDSAYCSSYLMYGDGMVADYAEELVVYPVIFWLGGASYEETIEIWLAESDGGNLVEGRNIWLDHYTVSLIEARGEGLYRVFNSDTRITLEAMSSSFALIGEISHYALEDQADYVYGFDVWEGEYQEGEYTINAVFSEDDGEKVLLGVMIWRNY